MSSLAEQQVRAALSPVTDKVSGVSVNDRKIIVTIERGAALEPLRRQVQAAAEAVAGGREVMAILTAEKKPQPAPGPQHKISQRPVAPEVKHIIAVASGKGGVGKSTVAANLAAALAMQGLKTGLLDADIYGSSQPRMTGLRQKPELDKNKMILPLEAHGLKIMSMGFFVPEDAPMVWRGPMVHTAIQQLLRDVAWGPLDVLVIDLPPGTGDAQLSLAQNVKMTGAVIVSTPQDVALSEARKAIAMFGKVGVPTLGMIENMSYYACPCCGERAEIFGHGGALTEAARLNIPFLGEIPIHTDVRIHADAGKPLVAAIPAHPVSVIYMKIAETLAQRMKKAKASA